ncbi:MAG TPA: MarR family transcriptional regulator [Bacillus bacterium]|nr:MarR family transcriptional regulator [Bacillus sp. (in: firmicutes)]
MSQEPQMVSSISEKVLLSNSTVSGIIDRLEKNGYVKRVRDQNDRRIVWVTETDKLIKLREQSPVLNKDFSGFLLEDLESNEIEQIVGSLQLLSAHMQKKLENYKNNSF